MMKNNNKINIDLVNTADTTEHNGVEVKITNVVLYKYIEALKKLYYMPNIYINSTLRFAQNFNERKIFKYNNFYTGAKYQDGSVCHVLLGNIVYPLDITKFPKYNKSNYGCDNYKDIFKFIEFKFEIGELEVTPTREGLKYTDNNIKVITNKIENVVNELSKISNIQNSKNYDDILIYYKTIKSNDFNILLGETKIPTAYTFLSKEYDISYNGVKYSSSSIEMDIIGNILNIGFTDYIYRYANGIFSCKSANKHKSSLNRLLFGNSSRCASYSKVKFMILPEATGTKGNYFKDYFKTCYGYYNDIIILEPQFNSIASLIHYCAARNVSLNKSRKCLWTLNQIKKALLKKVIFADIINSDDYIKYKLNRAKEAKEITTVFDKEITAYLTYCKDNYTYSITRTFKDVDSLKKILSQYTFTSKKGEFVRKCIYCCRDNYKARLLFEVYKNSDKLILLTVAKTNIKYLKNLPEEFINIDDFLTYSNHKYLDYINKQYSLRLHTDIINSDYKMEKSVCEIAKYMPSYISKLIKDFIDNCKIDMFDEVKLAIEETPKQYLRDTYKHNVKLYEKYKNTIYVLATVFNIAGVNDMFIYFAVKNAILRIDFNKFISIKNKLFINNEKSN